MTTNVSDTTPVPLNPTHSELAPFALLKNLSEHSAAPKTPCNSIRGGLYTPRVIPYGLSMDCTQSMESIWTIFLAGSPAIVSVHTQYGIHMDCLWNGAIHGPVHGQSIWIPYGFHGISNEF
jgi:hypothetical protein